MTRVFVFGRRRKFLLCLYKYCRFKKVSVSLPWNQCDYPVLKKFQMGGKCSCLMGRDYFGDATVDRSVTFK